MKKLHMNIAVLIFAKIIFLCVVGCGPESQDAGDTVDRGAKPNKGGSGLDTTARPCEEFVTNFHQPAVVKMRDIQNQFDAYGEKTKKMRQNFLPKNEEPQNLGMTIALKTIENIDYGRIQRGISAALDVEIRRELADTNDAFKKLNKDIDEGIDLIKKVKENYSTECENIDARPRNNQVFSSFGGNKSAGEEGYLKNVEDMKHNLETVIIANEVFRTKVASARSFPYSG